MAKSAALDKPAKGGTLVTLESLREDTPRNLRFEDVVQTLGLAGDLAEGSEFGSGWEPVPTEEKIKLVGVPLALIDWQVNTEGRNGTFVSIKAITADDRHIVINDGSMKSGIGQQIMALKEKGETRAILLRRGLRVSEYEYTDEQGNKKPAKTFYLDFTA